MYIQNTVDEPLTNKQDAKSVQGANFERLNIPTLKIGESERKEREFHSFDNKHYRSVSS